MPNQLDITLRASATVTADGVGSAVDVEDRTYTEITLDITAITGTINVVIESSPSLSSWTALGHFNTLNSTGLRKLVIPEGSKWLRAKWTVGGVSPSITFVITGRAHQLYITPEDMRDTSEVVAKAMSNIPVLAQAKACLAASAEAEAYLAGANTLPIKSLDAATLRHIAKLGVFELFQFRPGTAVAAATTSTGSSSMEVGRSEALGWLKSVATGKARPPGLVDATPETEEEGISDSELIVISNPGRGW